MKKQFVISLSAVAGSVLLSACGDDVTKVTNVNEVSGMEVVASADSLGECDSANVGKTVFASDKSVAYVCADSGWVSLAPKVSDGKDGKDGLDGTSCTARLLSDSSGYKIVCGEDSVGVIANGQNGANGKDGADGKDGENGESCLLEPLSDGDAYKIVCGGDSVGVFKNGLDGVGCSLEDNGDGTVSHICGEDTVIFYKALCGETAYEPQKAFCYEKALYSCAEKPYDPSRRFCDTRDAKIYSYVVIGEQTWMAENLNIAYPKLENLDSNSFCYKNSADSCAKYGRLYTWAAAMDSAAQFYGTGMDCGYDTTCITPKIVRGVCPEGWHLPSNDEWNTLETYVSNHSSNGVGYALKSTSGWNSSNGMNSFGFGVLPAGLRVNNGTNGAFLDVLEAAHFWSATESDKYFATSRYLDNDNTAGLGMENSTKPNALSVRCVKD